MSNEKLPISLPSDVIAVRHALMSDYTTFGLGGPCRWLIDCPNAAVLTAAAQGLAAAGQEFLVIGQGSNLLVSDGGVDRIVLRFCSDGAPDVVFEEGRVRVSGDTLLDDLARLAIDHGVGDVSFCSGIPGTVGGAIAGNAGAFGRQIGDVVDSVRVMDPAGRIRDLSGAELEFEYRSSALKQSGAVVLEAELSLTPYDILTMRKERERILQLRRSKHPDWRATPCAGSVFRNIEPTSAAERRQAAGWFLEQAGAKDFCEGGAHLFEKHANIIVAGPEATALDVFVLSERMISAVRAKFGFELSREIRLIGAF
jgi:UDP-N-acetylmuramate dehydrogenase